MNFKYLTPLYIQIYIDCMKAFLNGPFIDDWEFHIRLGAERAEVRELLEKLEDGLLTEREILVSHIINNCCNEVCHGVGIREDK